MRIPYRRERNYANEPNKQVNYWINKKIKINERLRAFLFIMEVASPGYLGFGVYLIINLISSVCLRDVLFYVELAPPPI